MNGFLQSVIYISNVAVTVYSYLWYREENSKEALSVFIPALIILIGQTVYYLYKVIRSILASKAFDKYIRKKISIGQVTYQVRPALGSEIKEFYRDCFNLFGPEIMSLDTLQKIYNHNPHTIWIVWHQKVKDGLVVNENKIGFFELFPISKQAAQRFETGKKNGLNLVKSDICLKSAKASNYYIAGIGAIQNSDGKHSFLKASVMKSFYEFLFMINRESALKLYAKPATTDGMSLVKNNGFKKIHPDVDDKQSIWKLTLKKGALYYEGTSIRRQV